MFGGNIMNGSWFAAAMFLGLGASAVLAAETSGKPVGIEVIMKEIKAGKVQCLDPDIKAKTCRGFSEIKSLGEGRFAGVSSSMIPGDPRIIMHSPSEGVLKNGKICWKITKRDIGNVRFEMDGKPAPQSAGARVLPMLALGIGVELCEMLVQDEKGLVNQGFADGKRNPNLDQRVAWIDPKAGYKIVK
jgi:hypothetical protein